MIVVPLRLALRSLKLRRFLALLHAVGDFVMEGFVDIRHPARGRITIEIEMLVFHAAGLNRQQNQIAALPVLALTFDDGVAFSLDDVNRQPALVAVLA